MKNDLSCEVVRDLIPGYCDGLLSEVSKQAVDAHLEQCESCRGEACGELSFGWGKPEDEEDLLFAKAFRKLNLGYRFLIGTCIGLVILVVAACVAGGLQNFWSNRVYNVVPEQITFQMTDSAIRIEGTLPDGYYGDFGSWSYHVASGRMTLCVQAKKDKDFSDWKMEYEYPFEADFAASEPADILELWVEGMDAPLWVAGD